MYRNDTFPGVLPHGRKRSRYRQKLFGVGRPVPLDRNAKVRVEVRARALMHPVAKGKHWGAVTAKAFEVLKVLMWTFHNAGTGFCFPSYEAIAKAAHCCRDTVAEAIKMLEAAGILAWCNRIKRVWIDGVRKVVRTSNSYRFNDPRSKSEIPSGTKSQDKKDFPSLVKKVEIRPRDPNSPLETALAKLRAAVKNENDGG
jgi:hypothetical protein